MQVVADFSRLVDDVYEAALLPERWPVVLDEIAKATGSAGGVLSAGTPAASPALEPRVRWVASQAVDHIIARYLEEGWAARCGWLRRGFQAGNPGFVLDTDLFTAAEADADPSYRFFRSHGIGGSASLFMRVPPSETFVFSFDRWSHDGPATRETVNFLDALRPHLSRAALISARLGLERAHAAAQALAMLGLPAAVLSPKHRIIAANDLMQEQMPVRVDEDSKGRIRLCDRRADPLLGEALTSAAAVDLRGASVDHVFSIPVAATEEHSPMVVHVVPIRRRARDIFASAASIVLMTPVRGRELPAAGVIQGLFDLTAAETRVARAIAHGETVDRIAIKSQISEGTVRSHLKSVFVKTGVSRQAALANLLNSMAIRPETFSN